MRKIIVYLKWIAALIVFIGIPLNARYKNSISFSVVLVGIISTVLLLFIEKKIRR